MGFGLDPTLASLPDQGNLLLVGPLGQEKRFMQGVEHFGDGALRRIVPRLDVAADDLCQESASRLVLVAGPHVMAPGEVPPGITSRAPAHRSDVDGAPGAARPGLGVQERAFVQTPLSDDLPASGKQLGRERPDLLIER